MLLHNFKKGKDPVSDVDKMKEEELTKFLTKIEDDKLAEFEHWTVYLDIKQYYLGRVFIWAKRPDAHSFLDLSTEEWSEIQKIFKDLKQMYTQTFEPDTINMAFLGNDVEHCHCHCVPRYKKSKNFDGIAFKDENWGHNYSNANTKTFVISKEVHERIRETLSDSLKKILETKPSGPSVMKGFY
ncbi:MAG: HIT family protein [Gammaproteobacteria bacterium]|jgi:diadenosine tetraphosphate (Ap4A) HIT family hydrolase|nr:HIT family protein [Gammaproteobacteria bacterium]